MVLTKAFLVPVVMLNFMDHGYHLDISFFVIFASNMYLFFCECQVTGDIEDWCHTAGRFVCLFIVNASRIPPRPIGVLRQRGSESDGIELR